jgi:hypothetical protein
MINFGLLFLNKYMKLLPRAINTYNGKTGKTKEY